MDATQFSETPDAVKKMEEEISRFYSLFQKVGAELHKQYCHTDRIELKKNNRFKGGCDLVINGYTLVTQSFIPHQYTTQGGFLSLAIYNIHLDSEGHPINPTSDFLTEDFLIKLHRIDQIQYFFVINEKQENRWRCNEIKGEFTTEYLVDTWIRRIKANGLS